MTRDSQTVNDVIPRVRHLEAEVADIKEGQKLVFGELKQINVGLASLQAGRPALGMMDGLKTGLAILQTMVLLIGAAVASIVYVSSNANNGAMALMQERIAVIGGRTAALEQHVGWAPTVKRGP